MQAGVLLGGLHSGPRVGVLRRLCSGFAELSADENMGASHVHIVFELESLGLPMKLIFWGGADPSSDYAERCIFSYLEFSKVRHVVMVEYQLVLHQSIHGG